MGFSVTIQDQGSCQNKLQETSQLKRLKFDRPLYLVLTKRKAPTQSLRAQQAWCALLAWRIQVQYIRVYLQPKTVASVSKLFASHKNGLNKDHVIPFQIRIMLQTRLTTGWLQQPITEHIHNLYERVVTRFEDLKPGA